MVCVIDRRGAFLLHTLGCPLTVWLSAQHGLVAALDLSVQAGEADDGGEGSETGGGVATGPTPASARTAAKAADPLARTGVGMARLLPH